MQLWRSIQPSFPTLPTLSPHLFHAISNRILEHSFERLHLATQSPTRVLVQQCQQFFAGCAEGLLATVVGLKSENSVTSSILFVALHFSVAIRLWCVLLSPRNGSSFRTYFVDRLSDPHRNGFVYIALSSIIF